MGWWLKWRVQRLRVARDTRVARLRLAQLGGDQEVISRHRKAIARYTRRIKMLTASQVSAARTKANAAS